MDEVARLGLAPPKELANLPCGQVLQVELATASAVLRQSRQRGVDLLIAFAPLGDGVPGEASAAPA